MPVNALDDSFNKNFGQSIIERLKQINVDRENEIKKRNEQVRIDKLWSEHPSGNDYAYGNCTYGVASWTRVPYGMGNANTWYIRARQWGFNVGLEPRAGAVGVSEYGYYGHVVLVLAVNNDGTITIREQNYDWNGSIRETITDAKSYKYIYF
jgi:surface antigen